jgi:hypothetical protein
MPSYGLHLVLNIFLFLVSTAKLIGHSGTLWEAFQIDATPLMLRHTISFTIHPLLIAKGLRKKKYILMGAASSPRYAYKRNRNVTKKMITK